MQTEPSLLPTANFRSRDQVFDYLDDYAYQRRGEIDRHLVTREAGFIKTYLLETSPDSSRALDVQLALNGTGWGLTPIDPSGLYFARDRYGDLGYVEAISPRYLMLHSTRKTDDADRSVQTATRDSAQLDFIWLAGEYFSNLWSAIILPVWPERFVSLRFEHHARFETDADVFSDDDDESESSDMEGQPERRASISSITEKATRIEAFLPQLQHTYAPFRAIKMLRLPAEDRGGYDFWSWGKVTHRSSSFREGRSQALSITKLYERATRIIEQEIWLRLEKVRLKGADSVTLRGAPVVVHFSQPLTLPTLHNFVEVTFGRDQGPFRLWGNPIWLGSKKAHVYGIDLHLWQRLYLEITPERLVAFLPKGTCGNSVHRLMTNIQRYIDPAAQMMVGEKNYSTIIRDALLG